MVLTDTVIAIDGSGKVHNLAGPAKTYLIGISEIINSRPFLSGP
jgi:hypothetical protein